MNFGKQVVPAGRTASRLSKTVVGKAESSLQKGVSARFLSTTSGLTVNQAAARLAVAKLPNLGQLSVSAGSKRQFGAASDADIKAVEAKTIEWRDTVTLNTEDAPKKTAALYDDDVRFWGTVSEEVRIHQHDVYSYFDFFARLPKLSMVAYDPEPPAVFDGKFAIHAGAYTFAWEGADGKMVETRARFTFAYVKKADGWSMVEHHSSKMPEAPPGLKPVV